MTLSTIDVPTNSRVEIQDITGRVRAVVEESGVRQGMCMVYTPHTTAAITVNENADPSVKSDMVMEINKVVPFSDNYRHAEGNSAAHLKSSLFGASESFIIEEGSLLLGTWQGIMFCEFDGPRRRRVQVKIIEG
jgi:secondary thiamine-phosphate synthase enzyme